MMQRDRRVSPPLDGTVTYAEVRSFKPEDLKTPGVAISTLNALTIAVQFVSLTQTGRSYHQTGGRNG